MSIEIGHVAAIGTHISNGYHAAAKSPFDGLDKLAPKTVDGDRKGSTEALSEAIDAASLDAAQEALRKLRAARDAGDDSTAEKLAFQKACITCKGQVDILA